jgi:hypothetical protein
MAMRDGCVLKCLRSFALLGLVTAIAGCEADEPTPANVVPGANPAASVPPGGESTVEKRTLHDAAATATVWQPTAEMLGLLSEQKIAVGPYSMRVPKDYAPGDLPVPKMPGGTANGGVLLGTARSDAITPHILWSHITVNPGKPARILDEIVDKQLKAIGDLQTEFAAEPADVGRIGDLGFARFRWQGVSNEGGFPSRGIVYVCSDGDAVLQFNSQARGGDQAAIDCAEAAVLSLTKS